MSASSSSFMFLLLVALAACDVNYYPYFGRTGISGGAQVLTRRPFVQQTGSLNRFVVLDADHTGFGGVISRHGLPFPHGVASPFVIGTDSFDSSDIYSDDRVIVVG